jgi:Domain of unknown function (DUF4389)
MSEQLPTTVYPDEPPPHPIHLVVTDDLVRSRLTVFFRLLLVIPHLIVLTLWGIVIWFVVLIAWVVSIFTGRVPDGLRNFIAMFLRYLTHVYAYLFIAANPYPGFTGEPGYPIDVEIAPGEKMSRLTIIFRLFLAIPALIVLWVLGYVAQIVAFFAWFWALFAGRLHPGLRDVLAYYLRYNAQVFGYLSLLTQRYPSFSDD